MRDFCRQLKKEYKNQNSVILSKFDGKFPKVNQVIYPLVPISTPDKKALAQIFLRNLAHIRHSFVFQRDITQKRGHNSDMKTYGSNFFSMEYVYEISKL